MMKIHANQWFIIATAVIGFSVFDNSQAQLLSIGTTAGGANAQIGASIASIVSSKTRLQMRPQKASGSQQVLETVNRGRSQFGVANVMQYNMAVNGTGLSEGHPPMDKIKLVATLMPFIQGVIVRKDSGIANIAELNGKRLPIGYLSSPLFTIFWKAFLENEGLSFNNINGVPVASLPKSWDLFKEGQVDAVIAAAGSAAVREMSAVIQGGIKYLPINQTDQLLNALPSTRIEKVMSSNNFDGIEVDTYMHVYEYVLFVNEQVNNETVREITKGIYENEATLKAATSLWNTYETKNISMDHKLNYHDGAIDYYKSENIWRE